MRFAHRFYLSASVEAVATFHAQSRNLAAITPPPIVVRLDGAPDRLSEGDEMAFTLWIGPLPIRWHSRIEGLSSVGFTDRLLHGPFESWIHRHTFVPHGIRDTEVRDEVVARLRRHAVWGPVGAFFWLGLPLLFAYRAWKTRRLLERV